MNKSCPKFFTKLDTVHSSAHVDILNVRTAGKMLYVSRTVENGIHRHFFKPLKACIVHNVSVKDLYTVVYLVLKVRAEVVEHHIFKTFLCGIESAFSYHTVCGTFFAAKVLRKQVGAHISGCAGNENVAHVTQLAVSECFHSIAL